MGNLHKCAVIEWDSEIIRSGEGVENWETYDNVKRTYLARERIQ